jgi:hypothetical protein
MTHLDPPDRLQWGRQLELFGGEPSPHLPTVSIRTRCARSSTPFSQRHARGNHAVAARQREAQSPALSPVTFWLPEEEGAQLRLEFETEMARLDAAA